LPLRSKRPATTATSTSSSLAQSRLAQECAVGGEPLRMVGRLLVRPIGVELDLDGVVKGQTVDDAIGLLSGEGFVSAGGDYVGRGAFDVALPGGASIRVTHGGLATSGRRGAAGCAQASGNTI
jgi:thiamine biosynthesis lipoprotein ApbE